MTTKDKWVSFFEQVIGRKPSPQEFLAGKETDFDFKQIRTIANSSSVVGTSNQMSSESVTVIPDSRTKLTGGRVLKRVLLGLAIFLLLGLGGAYRYFDQESGAEATLATFASALDSKDYDQIAQLLSSEKTTWSKEEARGFLAYLEAEGIDITAELEKLASSERTTYIDERGNKLFGLEEAKKKFWLFPNFQVMTYPVELLVFTNLDGVKVNDQAIDKDQEIGLGEMNFAPRQLNVQAASEMGDLGTQVSLDLDSIELNQAYLDLRTKNKTISANLPEGLPKLDKVKFYVNDQAVADSLSSDVQLLDHQEVVVYATFFYDGNEYTSEKVEVNLGQDEEIEVSLKLSDETQSKLDKAKQAKEKTEQEEVTNSEQPDSTAQTQSNARWNASKDAQLAEFMVSWGNRMGQPGYMRLDSGQGMVSGGVGALIWQGSGLDARYSSSGVSDAYYTIVSAYSYSRGGGKTHTYHFAILPDGGSTVIYSEQATGAGYIVSKLNTDNAELRNGFASIVNQ